ncbi:hypothetical protein [Dyadobacter sp. OTU695]|uniref:hypothetical protein n=1 Tax=Dyadobacter sp. OTU695 TaxID=3043860 RepID=UPI00313E6907
MSSRSSGIVYIPPEAISIEGPGQPRSGSLFVAKKIRVESSDSVRSRLATGSAESGGTYGASDSRFNALLKTESSSGAASKLTRL